MVMTKREIAQFLAPMLDKQQKRWSIYFNLDWSKSNHQLAKETGKTRERIRQVRERFGRAKVGTRGRPKKLQIAA